MEVSLLIYFRPRYISNFIDINDDVATPSTSVVANGAGFVLTGDPVAYNARFGSTTTVKLFLDLVVPPPLTTTYTARVEAVDASNSEVVGYIFNTINTSGEYVTTSSIGLSLQITFQVPVGATTASQINILAVNPNSYQDIPQIGGITGFPGSALGPGAPGYEDICNIYRDFANSIYIGFAFLVQPLLVGTSPLWNSKA
jgi:hypothetical protein